MDAMEWDFFFFFLVARFLRGFFLRVPAILTAAVGPVSEKK